MDQALQPEKDGTAGVRLPLLCIGVGLASSVVLALLSDGSYHHDALTHYLYAQWAWGDVRYLLDEWGRPGVTGLLFPPARLGWTACRIETAGLSALCAWMAFDLARRLRWRRAGWVPLLCFVQPMFVLASYTTLAETAAAFYLTLALWCLVSGRPAASGAVISLCFVTRYEMLVFIPLWTAALWSARGRWTCYAMLLWAPMVHNLLGREILGRWPALFLFAAEHTTMYGNGTPLTMLVKSMAASGPAVAMLALVGSLVGVWTGQWSPRRVRPASGQAWLIPACYLAYLLTHTLLFWRGMYASGGYPRFLVSTSPLAALCAVGGLNALLNAQAARRRQTLVLLAVVALVMWVGVELEVGVTDEAWIFLIEPVRWLVRGLTVLMVGAITWMLLGGRRVPGTLLAVAAAATTIAPLAYLVRPHRISERTGDIEQAVNWLRSSELADAPVIATNIWVSYYLDRGFNVVPPDSTAILDDATPGTVFIWDADYSPTPRFEVTPESMADRRGWQQLWHGPTGSRQAPVARIFVRQSHSRR